jgi:hypothetical protein
MPALACRTGRKRVPAVRRALAAAPRLAAGLCLALVAGTGQAEPKLVYRSLEIEAAEEYQPGWNHFGPGWLRFIGRAEAALNDNLTAKAVVSPCGGPYRTHPEGVTQCAVYRILEELTLGGAYEKFDFSLGRQIVTQGNTEGFILLDRYNGRDYCRFLRLDVNNKIPNWLGRGRAFLGPATLTVNVAPLSATSYLPAQNGYCADAYNLPGRFDSLDDPGNDRIADWAGGGELAYTRDSWGATLNVMSTREDLFVVETLPAPQKVRPRVLWLGGTASATLGAAVARTEIAYAPDRPFTLDPMVAGGMAQQGIPTNGTDQRWNLLAAAGLEGRPGEWFIAFQYFHDRVGSGPQLVRQQQANFLSLRVRRAFFNDRLTFDSFTVFDLGYSDLGFRNALAYEVNPETNVELGATVYADFDHNTGLFGSYEGRESVYLKLRRTLF